MPSERFAVALRELQPGDWLLFEKLAAEFLAVEFPSLRTTAAAAGDKGRDGQLYVPTEDVTSACQYSVAADWRAKINATVRTLKETMPKVTRLIYCTNQLIGPAADDLVETLRRGGVGLDVRDASWFISRELTAHQRQVAAEELCARIVDPLLAARGIGERTGLGLSTADARVALLHLTLDGYDTESNKGLTKSCFESLVLAVMHDSSAEKPMTAGDIVSEVSNLIPAGDRRQVEGQANAALRRLSTRGGPIKHIARADVYHMAFEEQARFRERATHFFTQQESFAAEIARAVDLLDLNLDDEGLTATVGALRQGIETVLLHRGEAFASAVLTGRMELLDAAEVLQVLTDMGQPLPHLSVEAAAEIVLAVMEDPTPQTRSHLRALADGYTLFGFLRQTVDVQKVVLEVFSYGEVWLDTTVLLPLLTETLLDEPSERTYTMLLQAARDAGLNLYVTDGIVEEVERHLNRALQFARTDSSAWESDVPFVYAAYALAGRARAAFFDWLEEFRGRQTPEEDIKEYLRVVFGIQSRNLKELADGADPELRAAVQEIWAESHDIRRNTRDTDLTPSSTLRLVAHDVENSVGVIQLRRSSPASPMGYRHWLLTLDRVAFNLPKLLNDRLSGPAPASPALSPDFLTELLRLGPLRADLDRELHVALPVVTAVTRYEALPKELIELADATRRRYEGQNELVVRRRVKEALNDARWRVGSEAKGGVRLAESRVKSRLQAQNARGARLT